MNNIRQKKQFLIFFLLIFLISGFCSIGYSANGSNSENGGKQAVLQSPVVDSPVSDANKNSQEKKPGFSGLTMFLFLIPVILVFLLLFVRIMRDKPISCKSGISGIEGMQPMIKELPLDEKRCQVPVKSLEISKINGEQAIDTLFHFLSRKGIDEGKKFYLTKPVSTIGRRSTGGRINDIELSSSEKKVSRAQGKVVYKMSEDKFYLVNESEAAIFVNGENVTDAFPLRKNDLVDMGDGSVVLEFTDDLNNPAPADNRI